MTKRSTPTTQQIQHSSWHDPLHAEQTIERAPNNQCHITMKSKVINGFSILLTYTTPLYHHYMTRTKDVVSKPFLGRSYDGKQCKSGGRRPFVSTAMNNSLQAIDMRWNICSLLKQNIEKDKGELGRILSMRNSKRFEKKKEKKKKEFDLEDKCRVKGAELIESYSNPSTWISSSWSLSH